MIYFDNAATGGRKPDRVQTAVAAAAKICANPGRGGHALALACASAVQTCRERLSRFFGAYGFERTVFTKNCTEALNLALNGVLKKGDHVVVTCLEHNSVLRPLEYLRLEGKISYDVCPLTYGKIVPETLAAMVGANTRAVVVTSASNVTGYAPDLKEIRAALPSRVLLIVDGAQGAGHLPLNMKETGIDALAVAGHKGMMGIQGGGALLFSDRLNPAPVLFGGTGSDSFSLTMPDFYPDRLEAGTLAFPAIVSLSEGVAYLEERRADIADELTGLTARLIDGIRRLPWLKLYSRPNPCGIVSFAHVTLQSEMLSSLLSEKYAFAVRGGLHCAPLTHKALGTEENGLVRASFSHFNRKKEIDEFLSALKKIGANPAVM